MNQGRNRCMGNSVHLVQGSLWQRNLFRKRGEDSPGTRGPNIIVHTIALSVQYVAIIAAFLARVYPWQLSPLTAAVTSPYRYRYAFNAYFYLRRCRVVEPLQYYIKPQPSITRPANRQWLLTFLHFFPESIEHVSTFFLDAWFHVKPAVQSATKRIVSLYPPVCAPKKQILLKLLSMVNRAWVIQQHIFYYMKLTFWIFAFQFKTTIKLLSQQ